MRRFIALIALLLLPMAATAQDQDQTLADIRQELSVLYHDIQRLKRELSTTGAPIGGGASGDLLTRVDTIEAALQDLTSRTEAVQHRVDSVVRDGTTRIGDLEFRLCELEFGCDVGSLGDTPSLGGVDVASPAPTAPPEPQVGDGGELALAERADFERAQASLDAGDFAAAAAGFAAFNETYPGSPLAAQAMFGRGSALEQQGDMQAAARSYLDAFSTSPDGAQAPRALLRLGVALDALGQRTEACMTLGEVETRFPGAEPATTARQEMVRLGCS
ncbi:tol-pal system protein YbgF [Poseidonocella pacifica]|uniref:Cell division coordinator CpoB n=1 Tax=Poseidonocella pacifica TaxID=871651 RepID=A0A1I0WMF6_9RHOB|nr:tol-pal system protein YbgF [Poseidonocella pacifica]SFA89350.1 tol-pal system protein YbgF [Poseidonocella pacifica]